MELQPDCKYIGLDTETFLISSDDVYPKVVCLTLAEYDGGYQSTLFGNGDPELVEALETLLGDPKVHLVAANAKYDFICLAKSYPSLVPLIWQAYADERIHCTVVREKVLNLSDFGKLNLRPNPDGTYSRVQYSLDAMGSDYLGIDRSAEKEGDDIWRVNYWKLDGKKADEYPPAARNYAEADAVEALQVFYAQQMRQQNTSGPVSLNTSEFQAAADFALGWITEHGILVDQEEFAKAATALEAANREDNYKLLSGAGILRPSEPPRPKKNAKRTVKIDLSELDLAAKRSLIEGVAEELGISDEVETTAGGQVSASLQAFTRLATKVIEAEAQGRASGEACQELLGLVTDRGNEIPMTKGVAPSINQTALRALVAQMRDAAGLPIVYSNPEETDEKKRNVSFKEEVVEEVAHLSPVLQEYLQRQKLQKLITTELPRMRMPDGQPAAKVHFVFNVLVETTRTSSYAGGTVRDKKTNKDKFLFPSANGQNVDPRIRPAYRPRDGWLVLSIDYSSIELVSAGSRQLSLFGHSKIADLLNNGVDLHAYMAGQLAYNLNENFRAAYESGGSVYDQDRIYEFFHGAKSSDDPDVVNFYKHWRKFAKPVDLGFPGGLGAETFVSFAKGYGVQITADDARKMRDIWIATFPEFQLGFDWINNQCQDPRWPVIGHKKNGKAIQGYAYSTPMGAYRSACAYTSAANGSMLQSPTAEAAKLAVFSAARACLDTGARTPLSGCFMLDFIHDEILFEIPEDGYEQERAEYASTLMVDAAKLIFPNVPVATEPALSRRWYKQADPVYDANGRLAVWEPSNEE